MYLDRRDILVMAVIVAAFVVGGLITTRDCATQHSIGSAGTAQVKFTMQPLRFKHPHEFSNSTPNCPAKAQSTEGAKG